MEPITTTIAAVTAASNAIGWIKQNIDNVASVGELGEKLATLFAAKRKLDEDRNAQSGVSDISFSGTVDAHIEAKLLAERMDEMRSLINHRFPKPADQKSTWQEILDIHNEKIREEKQKKIQAEKERLLRKHQVEEEIKAAFVIAGFILLTGLFFVGLFWIIVKG